MPNVAATADFGEISIVGLYCDAEINEEGIVWNGRLITPLKGPYDPTLSDIVLCKGKDNHGKAAMGFVKLAGAAALFFVPIPGARVVAAAIAINGACQIADELAHQEVKNEQNHPHPNDFQPPIFELPIGGAF